MNKIFDLLRKLGFCDGYIDGEGKAHRFNPEDRDIFIELEKICASFYSLEMINNTEVNV